MGLYFCLFVVFVCVFYTLDVREDRRQDAGYKRQETSGKIEGF